MNTVRLTASVSVNKGNIRRNNEDNFYLNGTYLTPKNRDQAAAYTDEGGHEIGLYGVFDGMGGEALGEEASLISAKSAKKAQEEMDAGTDAGKAVLAAIREANREICNRMIETGEKRIGTTFAALKMEEDTVQIYNVGDSRVYRLRNGRLTQLSVDDTTAQRMIHAGLLTEAQSKTHPDRHKLTQHLGIFPDEMKIEPHISQSYPLEKGDRFLVCSDGLTDMVPEAQIRELMTVGGDSGEIASRLVQEALRNGGEDNITALVICILSQPKRKAAGARKIHWVPIVCGLVLCVCGWFFWRHMGNAGKESAPGGTVESVYFAGEIGDRVQMPVGTSDYFRYGTEPAGADRRNAVFTSSDEQVITVNEDGAFCALQPGEATVTVTLEGKSAQCRVRVYAPSDGGGSSAHNGAAGDAAR